MRIVQVANFVTPTSGGLRTTLTHLAQGYADRGHEVVQVLPAPEDGQRDTAWGRQVLLRAPSVPGTGYRMLLEPKRVQRALHFLQPDRLEVHDRTTLRGLGKWAGAHGVPSLVVSHERMDRWLAQWMSQRLPLAAMADRANAGLVESYDAVVCTTAWAAEEFTRLGADNLVRIPLGVDLDQFVPRLTRRSGGPPLLLMASRLSREKRPGLALAALRELHRRGVHAHLVVAGDGPMRKQLVAESAGLPVDWRGFLTDRGELADLMAAADVVIAPGPVETFGLAALEALACGTPVVVNRHSALPEVVAAAGRTSPSSGFTFANAVQEVLALDELERRQAARSRAESFRWSQSVEAFLDVHAGRASARIVA